MSTRAFRIHAYPKDIERWIKVHLTAALAAVESYPAADLTPDYLAWLASRCDGEPIRVFLRTEPDIEHDDRFGVDHLVLTYPLLVNGRNKLNRLKSTDDAGVVDESDMRNEGDRFYRYVEWWPISGTISLLSETFCESKVELTLHDEIFRSAFSLMVSAYLRDWQGHIVDLDAPPADPDRGSPLAQSDLAASPYQHSEGGHHANASVRPEVFERLEEVHPEASGPAKFDKQARASTPRVPVRKPDLAKWKATWRVIRPQVENGNTNVDALLGRNAR